MYVYGCARAHADEQSAFLAFCWFLDGKVPADTVYNAAPRFDHLIVEARGLHSWQSAEGATTYRFGHEDASSEDLLCKRQGDPIWQG